MARISCAFGVCPVRELLPNSPSAVTAMRETESPCFAHVSALALALNEGLPECYGVLTPSTALGNVLANRLQGAGINSGLNRAPDY